jgi:hypothetical protein
LTLLAIVTKILTYNKIDNMLHLDNLDLMRYCVVVQRRLMVIG